MRTKNERTYDSFYYNFQYDLYMVGRDVKTFKKYRFKKFDKEFYDAYKNVICPYWKKYGVRPGLHWIKRTYNTTHRLDPRCIPAGIWYRNIIPHFNSVLYERQLQDKNLHHLLFHSLKRPETVFKCMGAEYGNDDLSPIAREEAYERCLQPGKYIIKPTTDTFEGTGIKVFNGEDGQESIYALLDRYAGLPFIVQRFVKQHPDLAVFNASTLNTVRLVTLVLNGEAHIISSILRIGADGKCVDNVALGGYQVTIRPDGSLESTAYTNRKVETAPGEFTFKVEYVDHTHTGAKFDGAFVPSWDKLCQTACEQALRLPYMKLIGWDLGVDEQGDVVLIEFNACPEQNESTCGPSFGDLTEEVLEEVFLRHPGRSVLKQHYGSYPSLQKIQ